MYVSYWVSNTHFCSNSISTRSTKSESKGRSPAMLVPDYEVPHYDFSQVQDTQQRVDAKQVHDNEVLYLYASRANAIINEKYLFCGKSELSTSCWDF